MDMHPYLTFNGQCEEAFRFYEKSLNGRVGELFRYGGSPMAGDVPDDWSDKVMHGSVSIGNQLLMGADVARYEEARGFTLSLQMTSATDAERIFGDLATGGTIVMALEKTFWAERFGMVIDRFGVPWTINCESPR